MREAKGKGVIYPAPGVIYPRSWRSTVQRCRVTQLTDLEPTGLQVRAQRYRPFTSTSVSCDSFCAVSIIQLVFGHQQSSKQRKKRFNSDEEGHSRQKRVAFGCGEAGDGLVRVGGDEGGDEAELGLQLSLGAGVMVKVDPADGEGPVRVGQHVDAVVLPHPPHPTHPQLRQAL